MGKYENDVKRLQELVGGKQNVPACISYYPGGDGTGADVQRLRQRFTKKAFL